MHDSSASLNSYLDDVSKIPLLTPREEKELARAVRAGDESAREKLITSNLRFVLKIARGYCNQGLPFQDLVQEGNIGLMEAIKRFDPEKGFRLTTYAGWWINLYIQRALEQKSRPIKLPINKVDLLRRVKAYIGDQMKATGKRPALEQVSHALGVSTGAVERILSYDASMVSLETPVGDEGAGLEDFLQDGSTVHPEGAIYRDQIGHALRKAMTVLSTRERNVILKRFGILSSEEEGASLRAVGSELGLSAEGVRRVEHQALRKLRRPCIQKLIKSILAMLLLAWIGVR